LISEFKSHNLYQILDSILYVFFWELLKFRRNAFPSLARFTNSRISLFTIAVRVCVTWDSSGQSPRHDGEMHHAAITWYMERNIIRGATRVSLKISPLVRRGVAIALHYFDAHICYVHCTGFLYARTECKF